MQGRRSDVLEENLYWEELMEEVDRPSARDMLQRLAPSMPMGVDREAKGVSKKPASLFDYYLTVRRRHPRKLVLSRVGDFYEAFGYDAVLLVQVSPGGPKRHGRWRAALLNERPCALCVPAAELCCAVLCFAVLC